MNILFVGNSYTYYNDMPAIFAALANENGKDVRVDSVTKGGRKLYENLVAGDEYRERIVALCAETTYDVLVLQEQSYFALVDDARFFEGLSGVMKLVNAKRTVFYATWGRKVGCPLLDELGLTSVEMTKRLAEAYATAAEACCAEVSPVGHAFVQTLTANSTLELYMPDLSHPSLLGSTLAALTHYRAIFGELPKRWDALKLDADTAALLFEAVKSVF